MHSHASLTPLVNPFLRKAAEEADYGKRKRASFRSGPFHTLFMAFAAAGMLCLMGAPASVRATDCAAATGAIPLTPESASEIDCPPGSRPCPPNACTCYAGGCDPGGGAGGAAQGSLYSGCGPVTTCVLMGADPPISNSNWQGLDLTGQGPPGGARTLSGKCPPPDDNGNTNCPTCPSGQQCGTAQTNP